MLCLLYNIENLLKGKIFLLQEPTNIGRRIYDLRIERDVQQRELAKAIHLHQSVLNRIEKGTRPARDAEIRAIALFFHVSADDLLGMASVPESSPDDERLGPSVSECTTGYDTSPTHPPASRKRISPEEHDLIEKYRELDNRGQTTVRHVLYGEYRYLQKQQTDKQGTPM